MSAWSRRWYQARESVSTGAPAVAIVPPARLVRPSSQAMKSAWLGWIVSITSRERASSAVRLSASSTIAR